jgi:hypothetical protein
VKERKIKGEKILLAAVVAVALAGASANAAELPSYEFAGFPISLHQIAVLGSTANVKEQSPSSSLTMRGMPASPHQVSVLTPRRKTTRQLVETGHRQLPN